MARDGTVLQYIGGGSFLPGVPARDLTPDDVSGCDYTQTQLINSGLYRKLAGKAAKSTHLKRGGSDNHSSEDED